MSNTKNWVLCFFCSLTLIPSQLESTPDKKLNSHAKYLVKAILHNNTSAFKKRIKQIKSSDFIKIINLKTEMNNAHHEVAQSAFYSEEAEIIESMFEKIKNSENAFFDNFLRKDIPNGLSLVAASIAVSARDGLKRRVIKTTKNFKTIIFLIQKHFGTRAFKFLTENDEICGVFSLSLEKNASPEICLTLLEHLKYLTNNEKNEFVKSHNYKIIQAKAISTGHTDVLKALLCLIPQTIEHKELLRMFFDKKFLNGNVSKTWFSEAIKEAYEKGHKQVIEVSLEFIRQNVLTFEDRKDLILDDSFFNSLEKVLETGNFPFANFLLKIVLEHTPEDFRRKNISSNPIFFPVLYYAATNCKTETVKTLLKFTETKKLNLPKHCVVPLSNYWGEILVSHEKFPELLHKTFVNGHIEIFKQFIALIQKSNLTPQQTKHLLICKEFSLILNQTLENKNYEITQMLLDIVKNSGISGNELHIKINIANIEKLIEEAAIQNNAESVNIFNRFLKLGLIMKSWGAHFCKIKIFMRTMAAITCLYLIAQYLDYKKFIAFSRPVKIIKIKNLFGSPGPVDPSPII